jgi:hypothetical protein
MSFSRDNFKLSLKYGPQLNYGLVQRYKVLLAIREGKIKIISNLLLGATDCNNGSHTCGTERHFC